MHITDRHFQYHAAYTYVCIWQILKFTIFLLLKTKYRYLENISQFKETVDIFRLSNPILPRDQISLALEKNFLLARELLFGNPATD